MDMYWTQVKRLRKKIYIHFLITQHEKKIGMNDKKVFLSVVQASIGNFVEEHIFHRDELR